MANFIDFHLGAFKVGSINSTAGIFVGQNLQYGWRGSSKANMAIAKVTGDDNRLRTDISRVDDPDLLDTWVQKNTPLLGPPAASPFQAAQIEWRAKREQGARSKGWFAASPQPGTNPLTDDAT